MASNTTVLIVVTALAVLVLAIALVVAAYKTHSPRRHVTDGRIDERAADDALRLRGEQGLAEEDAASVQAAEATSKMKSARTHRCNNTRTPIAVKRPPPLIH